MSWARQVALMAKSGEAYEVLVAKPEDRLDDIRLHMRIQLKQILKEQNGMAGTEFVWFRTGTCSGHDGKSSGSAKCAGFLG